MVVPGSEQVKRQAELEGEGAGIKKAAADAGVSGPTYRAGEVAKMREVAERVHGIGVSPSSIGYSFRDDLSMVGIIPGEIYGTLAHELAHDIDWQLARARYGARGGYATDMSIRANRHDRIAAAMMEPPGGTALVEESICEAMDFRRAMRKVSKEYGENDWWFKVWGPDTLPEEGIGEREDWILRSDAEWHGFGKLSTNFNMLDPVKATVVTPGLDISGTFAEQGIPAALVSKYLAEHGVVVEKTGLYSFFILFTIGITKGRWNTLLTALQQFKDDYDRNQPMWRILPDFCKTQPTYERMGLRDLCQQIHQAYRKYDLARLTTEVYLSDMIPALKPSDAYAKMAHGDIERVGIDELEGRVTGVLLTPYPPGIPLLIPGERFNSRIVEYLQFAREFNARFPGFETYVHGLAQDIGPDGLPRYYVDCVLESETNE